MAARRSPLPDLKTLDADLLRTMLEAAHEELLSRDDEVEYLKLQLQKLRRMLFGIFGILVAVPYTISCALACSRLRSSGGTYFIRNTSSWQHRATPCHTVQQVNF
jgi:hypothetical protein